MSSTRPSTSFYVIASIFLIWNIFGAVLFITDFTKSPEDIAAMEEWMQPMYLESPWWSWAGYGVATIGGLIAAIALLLRSRYAFILFVISMFGILVNDYYTFGVSDMMTDLGPWVFFMPILVVVIEIIEIVYTKVMIKRGVLT